MKNTDNNLILLVAKEVAAIVPNCLGVTMGGSRAYGLEDEVSDVEMYFYSTIGAPKLEDIDLCMEKLGATHRRSEQFLWEEEPWGPHSFFEIEGLYFEIGYRKISDIFNHIRSYQSGAVAPRQDCHDLGLGYMYSGLAASVVSEKVLLTFGDEIHKLKKQAIKFPDELFWSLKSEYLETARSLLNGKLLSAAYREDIFFYDLISNRIIRALLVMAFALSKRHFPGDKWNAQLLMLTDWNKADMFLNNIMCHALAKAETKDEFLKRRDYLVNALNIIDEAMEDQYGTTL